MLFFFSTMIRAITGCRAALQGESRVNSGSFLRLRNVADDGNGTKLTAAAASIGLSRRPNAGYKNTSGGSHAPSVIEEEILTDVLCRRCAKAAGA
jgi:hypothetical protein